MAEPGDIRDVMDFPPIKTVSDRSALMKTYQARLNAHLAAYRRDKLGVLQAGSFEYRGRTIRREHVLPEEHEWLNILPPALLYVQAHLAANPRVKRHRYFHHLNSSQAFAWNLFLPYFCAGRDGSEVLLRALG
jgi:hypothetical protein